MTGSREDPTTDVGTVTVWRLGIAKCISKVREITGLDRLA